MSGFTVNSTAPELTATIDMYTPGTDSNPFPAASELWTYYNNGAADGNRVAFIIKFYSTFTVPKTIYISNITFDEFPTSTQPYGAAHAHSTDVYPATTQIIANDASWEFYQFDLVSADSWPTTANGDGFYAPEILAERDAAGLKVTADGHETDPYLVVAFTLEFSKGASASLKARITAQGGSISLSYDDIAEETPPADDGAWKPYRNVWPAWYLMPIGKENLEEDFFGPWYEKPIKKTEPQ